MEPDLKYNLLKKTGTQTVFLCQKGTVMQLIELSQTQKWITDALLEIMKNKNYQLITIREIVEEAHIGRRTFYRYYKTKDDILQLYCDYIMQDFANRINSKKEMTLYSVALSYFEFWEDNINFLHLLQQNNMLHIIGNQLPHHLKNIALLTGHVEESEIEKTYMSYLYIHHFNLGGFWSVTTCWASQEQRESPENMAEMLSQILSGLNSL